MIFDHVRYRLVLAWHVAGGQQLDESQPETDPRERLSLKTPGLEQGMGENWLELLWNEGKMQVSRGERKA